MRKLDLREIGIDGENWIWLARDGGPMAGFCEHCDEPSGYIKKAGYFLASWVTIGFSNNVLHYGVSK
jgi:hypothetical protein